MDNKNTNFTNIFKAAFPPIFVPKSIMPNLKYKNLRIQLLYQNTACKMLVILRGEYQFDAF